MKTLYESIKHNIGIGRYAIGNRIIEDGVPCTVVLVKDNKAYLLSDVFLGRGKYLKDENVNTRDYIKNDGSGNFSFLKSCNQTKSMKIPNGWSFPGKIYADDSHYNVFYNVIKTNLRKFISEITLKDGNGINKPVSNYFLVQWVKSDKCDAVYYIDKNTNYILGNKSEFDSEYAPIRFAKEIEL